MCCGNEILMDPFLNRFVSTIHPWITIYLKSAVTKTVGKLSVLNYCHDIFSTLNLKNFKTSYPLPAPFYCRNILVSAL